MTRYPPVTDYFLLGKVLKSHGTTGQIRIQVEDRFKSYCHPGGFLFFDFDGSKVPYHIAETEADMHHVITLTSVASKDISDALAGKDIWIPIQEVRAQHLKSPKHLQEAWNGYRIEDLNTNQSYRILRTEEYPQQLMAVVDVEGKEYLIPMNEDLMESIDKERKILVMDLPEGLLAT